MFDAYLHEIADAYEALPAGDKACGAPHVLLAWQELADDSLERAAGIRLLIDVRETDADEPYGDGEEMIADIAAGRFTVSRANSEHPVWNVRQNVAFRIVHDVLGHYAASVRLGFNPARRPRDGIGGRIGNQPYAGFDWSGENLACAAHLPLVPSRAARMALFTECLAQTAYAIDRDGFGEQKIGDLGPIIAMRDVPRPDALIGVYAQWLNGNTQ